MIFCQMSALAVTHISHLKTEGLLLTDRIYSLLYIYILDITERYSRSKPKSNNDHLTGKQILLAFKNSQNWVLHNMIYNVEK